MKTIIICVFLLVELFDYLLKYLNYRHRNAPLPANCRDVYDNETYAKRNAYEMENLKCAILYGLCVMAVNTAFLVFDWFSKLYAYAGRFTGSDFWRSVITFATVMAITGFIGILFNVYGTFSVEARYGFNKSTKATFVADTIKKLVLTTAITGGLFALFYYLYNTYKATVFVVFYVVLCLIIVILTFFMQFFARIFNKFTPLADGSLKERIKAMAGKMGFPVRHIYVMNASKRSSKLNAYFSGFGKNRRIVLYDTLVETMTEDEILAVLAHEMGHAKHRHVLTRLLLTLCVMGLFVFIARFVVGRASISTAFGFKELNVAFGAYIFFILLSPISIPINILQNYISRRCEYTADRCAADAAGKNSIISALKTLARANYSSLTPHPFVVLVRYSHPPLSDRIANVE